MDPPRQIPPTHPGSSQTVQYPLWPFQILQTILDPSSLKNISAAVSSPSPWLKSGRLHVLYSDLKVEDAVESFFFCCNPWRTLSLPSAWMCRSWSCWPVLYTILILLPLIPFKNYLVASWPIFCPHTHITALMISFSLVSFGTFLLFSIYNPQ